MSHLGSLVNQHRMIAAAIPQRYALDGIVQAGSYNSQDGTVTVTQCNTAAQGDLDENDQARVYQKVQLFVPGGFQHGCVGGERCWLIPVAKNAYAAMLKHHVTNSPHAPSGQTWLGMGQDLDQSLDAVSTKRYVDDVIARQIAQLRSDLAAWASASLRGGSGAAGPSLTAVTSIGSAKVKAFP